ncbi:MAG: hypothetical protein ACXWLL_10035 [Myxococcaceae bacterium]
MPVVPPTLPSTQRAGVVQVGPFASSQEPPSAAGATQIPLRLLPGRWQNAPALQSMTPPSIVPQAKVAVALTIRSHFLPSGTLQ